MRWGQELIKIMTLSVHKSIHSINHDGKIITIQSFFSLLKKKKR